jgi:hypothetical protein
VYRDRNGEKILERGEPQQQVIEDFLTDNYREAARGRQSGVGPTYKGIKLERG